MVSWPYLSCEIVIKSSVRKYLLVMKEHKDAIIVWSAFTVIYTDKMSGDLMKSYINWFTAKWPLFS